MASISKPAWPSSSSSFGPIQVAQGKGKSVRRSSVTIDIIHNMGDMQDLPLQVHRLSAEFHQLVSCIGIGQDLVEYHLAARLEKTAQIGVE